MAIGAVELSTITRAQDYTTIKQNEDNKGMMDQTVLGQQEQKTETEKATTVIERDNSDWHNKQQDAREKGSNEYAGDGGKNRKKHTETDRVIVKGRGGFDLKI